MKKILTLIIAFTAIQVSAVKKSKPPVNQTGTNSGSGSTQPPPQNQNLTLAQQNATNEFVRRLEKLVDEIGKDVDAQCAKFDAKFGPPSDSDDDDDE